MSRNLPRGDAPRPLRVAVGIVARGGQVLLHRRLAPDIAEYHRGWELPGGKVEPGESIAGAAAREVREETGQVVIGVATLPLVHHPPAAVAARRGGPIEVHAAVCRWQGGPPVPPAARWHDLAAIPWTDVICGSRELLAEFLTARRDELPAGHRDEPPAGHRAGHRAEPPAAPPRGAGPPARALRYRVTLRRAREPAVDLDLAFCPGDSRRYRVCRRVAGRAVTRAAWPSTAGALPALEAELSALLSAGHRVIAVDPRHPLRTWLESRP